VRNLRLAVVRELTYDLGILLVVTTGMAKRQRFRGHDRAQITQTVTLLRAGLLYIYAKSVPERWHRVLNLSRLPSPFKARPRMLLDRGKDASYVYVMSSLSCSKCYVG